MSQISAFLEKVATDSKLQDDLARISNAATAESLVALASEHGFSITIEDASSLLAAADDELSDADIEIVSGGVLGQDLRDLTTRINGDMANLRSRYPDNFPKAKSPVE
jgi:predicted ribosomally synthesized peptide with nif11-like leader